MLYFEDCFTSEKTTKGIKSMQMISNETLWCSSIVFINVIILEHSTTIKKVKISQNWDRKGQNCNFKLLATLMINFLITMFIKMIERNPILSFETTFIIVESFWGDLVPKKSTFRSFLPLWRAFKWCSNAESGLKLRTCDVLQWMLSKLFT